MKHPYIYTLPSLCLWPVRGTSGKSAPAKWSLMMLWPFVNCQSDHFPSIINAMDFTTALSATHPISELSFTFHNSMWKTLRKKTPPSSVFSLKSEQEIFAFRRCSKSLCLSDIKMFFSLNLAYSRLIISQQNSDLDRYRLSPNFILPKLWFRRENKTCWLVSSLLFFF